MSIPQTGGGPIEHSDQLAEYLAAGCKPRDDWRIGTEHEKFGYCKQSLKIMLSTSEVNSGARQAPNRFQRHLEHLLMCDIP